VVRYFHLVEDEAREWTCSTGRRAFDSHSTYEAALEHVMTLASNDSPSIVIAHPIADVPIEVASFD
jgi:hypothetical protein